jgi:hypothetical protein
MRTGDLITVEGKAGRVTARVLELRAAADMPDLPIDVSDEARKILADEYRRVAILAYRYGVERIPVMFVALEDESGAWCDLQGHALSITAATAAEEDPCPAPSTDTTPLN